jgi:hypothetical protein
MLRNSLPFVAIALLAASCAQPRVTGNPVLVDPETVSAEGGSTEEIYSVTQKAISELLNAPRLQNLPPQKIVLGRIVNQTGIRGYDDKLLYNRFLAGLSQAGGERFVFLRREDVAAERAAQLGGEVGSTGVTGAPAGADLVLTIELRSLRGAATRTIQYFFQLTALDGAVVWTAVEEFKKRA